MMLATARGQLVPTGEHLALVLSNSGQVIERELDGPRFSLPLPWEEACAGGLPGTAVDVVLASENGTTGTVDWLLTDNQGTVRDVAVYNCGPTRRTLSITSTTTPSGRSLGRRRARPAGFHLRRDVVRSRDRL